MVLKYNNDFSNQNLPQKKYLFTQYTHCTGSSILTYQKGNLLIAAKNI